MVQSGQRGGYGDVPADPGSGGSTSTTATTSSGGCQAPMRPKAIVVPNVEFVEGKLQPR